MSCDERTAPPALTVTDGAAPANKRFAVRRTSRASAVIRSLDRQTAYNCIVRDASSTGALIELYGAGRHQPDQLPAEVILTLPMERVEYTCRLVWTQGASAGLQFSGPARRIEKKQPIRMMHQQPKKAGSIGRLLGRVR